MEIAVLPGPPARACFHCKGSLVRTWSVTGSRSWPFVFYSTFPSKVRFFFWFLIFKIYFIGKAELTEERERKMELPSSGLLPQCLRQPAVGQAEARSCELHLGLPHEW